MMSHKAFDELYSEHREYEKKISYLINNDFSLSETDFYPPSDNRIWTTNIMDIDGGDNFADYCKDFFEMLDEEEYFQ